VNYSAAKAGVVGLTKTLAKEWGQFKINVNAVAFGFVETRLTASKEEAGSFTKDGEEIKLGIPEQLRQMAAILTQPNRAAKLHALTVPALVVHGLADKMVHVSGGRATAAAIPGAELLLIDGMGHDLPVALHETFADGIRRTANRAK
jgi:NAD(P)-dependent dehydrogenase (short-subunit alcohol dehydrogenase family)